MSHRFLVTLAASLAPLPALAQGFQVPTVIDGGDGPSAFAVGDLDADGIVDLVVVDGSGSNRVTVVLAPGIAPSNTSLPAGPDPRSAAVGDLDGDGDLDIAVSNFASETRLFLNDGAGGFVAGALVPSGQRNEVIRAGDLDGDGDLDLALANRGEVGKVVVVLGNGNGTFGAPSAWPTGGKDTVSLDLGDIDGDGDLDVLTANRGNHTYGVLIANGNGTFQAGVASVLPTKSPETLALGDLDGDGSLDVVVAGDGLDYRPRLVALVGDGAGGFSPIATSETGESLYRSGQVELADLDADGALDAIVPFGNGQAEITWGVGDGTFDPPTTVSVSDYASAVAAGDFDGDGLLDLAIADDGDDHVMLVAGTGSRSPAAATYTIVGEEEPSDIAIGDLDGDGLADIAIVAEQDFEVLLSTGVPGVYSAAPPASYNLPGYASPLTLGDLDGDSVLDAVLEASGDLVVLIGVGDGTFLAPTTRPVGNMQTLVYDVQLADMNGDGDLDVVSADLATDQVWVNLGNGNGTFGASAPFATGNGPIVLALGDLDGDGDIDAVTADHDSANGSASVLLGNGNGTFGAPTAYPLANTGSPSDVVLADLDADGDLDVVGTMYVGPMAVLINNGNGVFQAAVQYPAGPSPLRGTVGEFTGDGVPDAVLLNSAINTGMPSLGLYVGNGNGTFQPMVAMPIAKGLRMGVADLDGDGLDDIAATLEFQGGMQVLLQTP